MYEFIFFIQIYGKVKNNNNKKIYNKFYSNKIIVRTKRTIKNPIN